MSHGVGVLHGRMHGLAISDKHMVPLQRTQDAYSIDVPDTNQSCGHLLEFEAAKVILSKPAKPMNPHSQRLLAAQARTANPATKPAAVKAKAKAKAKVKSKGKAGSEEKADDTVKKRPSKNDGKDGGNEPSPTRTEYSQAKKKFFLENLECTFVKHS